MRKAWMLIGCPGSGKTWWAAKEKEPETTILSRDEIRIELGLCEEDQKCIGTKEEEDKVTEIYRERLAKVEGDVILDNTNANKYFRTQEIQELHKLGFHVIGVKMTTPLDICLERRKEQIPEDIITRLYRKAQKVDPSEFDEFLLADGKPKEEVCGGSEKE